MIKALYIHIPFCQRKCFYCDFPSYAHKTASEIEAYVDSLIYEINITNVNLEEGATLYFGGGTPSLLSKVQLSKILQALHNKGFKFSEISLEANPGTVNAEKLSGFKSLGINRLSFGVQTFKDQLLQKIGRIHNKKEAIQSILLAQEIGFKNINIDLMNSLPGQTIFDVYEDLKVAIELQPTHLSAYALKLEPGTVFEKLSEQTNNFLPDELAQEQMYELIPKMLEFYGFKRYEISNYAQKTYECAHNKVYWRYQNYYGFGLGACSFTEVSRKTNTLSLAEYLAAKSLKQPIPCTVEDLSVSERQGEYVFMNLRLSEGLDCKSYQLRFAEDLRVTHQAIIEKHLQWGLLKFIKPNNLVLTTKGFKYSNLVFSDFVK